MRLFRVHIKNFRNFRDVSCGLGQHAVILGENGAGKSNFLYALRLLLDPALPDASRYLDEEDFWNGGVAFGGVEIVVTLDLSDYEDDPAVLACLADHEVEPPSGWSHSVARLTYRYGPRDTLDKNLWSAAGKDEYDFAIFGRDDPSNPVPPDVRRYIGFKVLPALRDAESDLRAWKRSPLRPLLQELQDQLDPTALMTAAAAVDKGTDTITSEKPLMQLQQAIGTRLSEMLGNQHDLVPTFGFNSTDPQQLVQALQLFTDQKRQRQVSDTSLGLSNVLYLALLLLHTEQQETAAALAATLLGIEEPEAHLHPQLQRVVFRDLLSKKRPVLVSTHSPNIASVAPVSSLVVLHVVNGQSSIASFADATAFTADERADLERYLDVTRAEIVFARGVILVEGDAERFIIPAAARLLSNPLALDEYGITVCSVSGTDFVPYTKFLEALQIPHAILTDGDTRDSSAAVPPGVARGIRILHARGRTARANAIAGYVASGRLAEARTALEEASIFVGTRTLETDLVSTGAGARLQSAFKAVFPTSRDETVAPFAVPTGSINDAAEDLIIKLAERSGKGRFAQSFADQLDDRLPRIAQGYETQLRTMHRIDFDDIVLGSLELIRRDAHVRAALAAKYPWLVIDEYQDLGLALHEIVKILIEQASVRIFAVGDPDQSIYTFSGARPEFLDELANRRDVHAVRLAMNYRCRQRIIEASLHVLQPEQERGFRSASEDDDKGDVIFQQCSGGLEEQARYVLGKVREHLDAGMAPGDIGVFARRWGDLAPCAQAFSDAHIPHRLASARDYRVTPLTTWMEEMVAWCAGGWKASRPRISDIFSTWDRLSHARFGAGPGRREALSGRVGLYKALAPLREPSLAVAKWAESVDQALGMSAIIARPEAIPLRMRHDVRELGRMLASLKQGSTADQSLAEFAGIDRHKVILQSLHASKGLEYTVVFMIALEQGILPQYRESDRDARRLFYVGMTRAKREIHLLFSGHYQTANGRTLDFGPSPFLGELWKRLHRDA